jgi:hypothetical protein
MILHLNGAFASLAIGRGKTRAHRAEASFRGILAVPRVANAASHSYCSLDDAAMRSTEVSWSAQFSIDFDRMFEAVRNTHDVPEEGFASLPYNIAMS